MGIYFPPTNDKREYVRGVRERRAVYYVRDRSAAYGYVRPLCLDLARLDPSESCASHNYATESGVLK